MYPLHADAAFFQELRKIDHELFEAGKSRPCPRCGGQLDTAHFPRKPRGLGEDEERRFSLCCRRDGCRARLTPPSLRFLGRYVYSAWVVILASDFYSSLGLSRAISRKTLARWRALWEMRLAETHSFMRRARGILPPGHPPCRSPAGITGAFGFPAGESWISILKFFCAP
jgi:hypothetical protein